MTTNENKPAFGKGARINESIEITVRLGLIFLLIFYSFKIIQPFLSIVMSATIIAITLNPIFLKMVAGLGGKRKRAGAIFILLSVIIIGAPSFYLAKRSVSTVREVSAKWEAGKIDVPPPGEKVKEWPLIGEKTYIAWQNASTNLPSAAVQYQPELKKLGNKALGMAAQTGSSIVFILFSFIIAGVLMINGESAAGFSKTLFERLIGEKGGSYLELATLTIRSVAKGVLGTAVIQMVLATIGLMLAGIPLVGVWAAIVLFLAIIQLPPIIILGPIFVYYFSVAEPIPATIFCVWCIFVSSADAFIKPVLLGRGVEAPMLVILLGAIGGMILSGIMGLFVGAVTLALTYTLFITWMKEERGEQASALQDAE